MSVRSWSAQKAGLTRAIKTGDANKVKAECARAVAEWDTLQEPYTAGWPDDWSRWQRALDDILPWNDRVSLSIVAYSIVKEKPKHETRIDALYTSYCVTCPWSSSPVSTRSLAERLATKHREEHA